MSRTSIALATMLVFGIASWPLTADEGLVPLAHSGSWIAMAHHTSMVAPPDVCMIFNKISSSQMLLFRADEDETEIRVADEKWDLPADVAGTIKVSVGAWNGQFDVSHNSESRLDADLSKEDLLAMFAAMDKSATMTINVGKNKPMEISLSGSTKVTNAFLTCAGIKGGNNSHGTNPFQ
jgi:hypothetical protein